jgi:hypothetical protein
VEPGSGVTSTAPRWASERPGKLDRNLLRANDRVNRARPYSDSCYARDRMFGSPRTLR